MFWNRKEPVPHHERFKPSKAGEWIEWGDQNTFSEIVCRVGEMVGREYDTEDYKKTYFTFMQFKFSYGESPHIQGIRSSLCVHPLREEGFTFGIQELIPSELGLELVKFYDENWSKFCEERISEKVRKERLDREKRQERVDRVNSSIIRN